MHPGRRSWGMAGWGRWSRHIAVVSRRPVRVTGALWNGRVLGPPVAARGSGRAGGVDCRRSHRERLRDPREIATPPGWSWPPSGRRRRAAGNESRGIGQPGPHEWAIGVGAVLPHEGELSFRLVEGVAELGHLVNAQLAELGEHVVLGEAADA